MVRRRWFLGSSSTRSNVSHIFLPRQIVSYVFCLMFLVVCGEIYPLNPVYELYNNLVAIAMPMFLCLNTISYYKMYDGF